MIYATWGTDYDWKNDKCFDRPMHKECDAPILKNGDKYVCIGCGKEAILKPNMKEWIEERAGEKIETEKCFNCGNNTFESHYHKNARTLEWELGFGECKSCGTRMIV